MKLVSLIVSVLALALVAVALPSTAEACTCGPKPDPATAEKHADAVFIGTVFSSRRVPLPSDGENVGIQQVEWQFEIIHSYKGPTGRTVVRSPASSAACGRQYEEGARYLIYAEEVDGHLTDSECSRSALTTDAQEDFDVLGLPSDSLGTAPEEGGGLRGPTTPTQTLRGLPGAPPSIATSSNIDIITSQCDTVVVGAFTGEQFTQLVQHSGDGGFVCTRGVTVTGTVELGMRNQRVVSVAPEGLTIQGNLLVAAPSVVMGAKVTGTTLLSERALGSVLVANQFEGNVVSATSQLIGVGNTCSQSCAAPGGELSLGLHVPTSATGVLRQVPRAQVAQVPREPDGSFMGWHSPETPYRPKFEDKPEKKEIDLGDLTNEWPPPLNDVDGGPSDGDIPWVPVYGKSLQDGNWSIYVPLEAGRFRQPELGFIYVF